MPSIGTGLDSIDSCTRCDC